jgi:hypothetical protein
VSKISLAPDASGSGIFTIASPNSNTNRTLTLPDDTGTIVTNSGNQAGSFTTLAASSTATFAAGAVGTPAITTTGDTNTGIFFPAADTIAFAEGGAEAMRIDSSGNLLLGTTSYESGAFGAGFGMNINTSRPQMLLRNSATTETAYMGIAGNIFYVATEDAIPLAFVTSDTERARIDSTGRMLIATTTIPSGSNTAGLEIKAPNATSGQYAFAVLNSAATQYVLAFRNDGYLRSESVYAQTSGSAANVFVDSNGYLLRSTSSIKYKKDVVDYDKGLIAVQSLRPVYYKSNRTNADGNEDSHQYVGFIAEEIDAAGLTEFVQYGEDSTPESLAYGNMVALLTKAIQELSAKNDALEARIAALETGA